MAKKDDQQTNVRLPSALKDRITQAAEEAGRSFTAEMVLRLEASFESVLEATLLQARIAERSRLRSAWVAHRERIRSLQEELTVAAAKEAEGDTSIADRVDLLRNEIELITGDVLRLRDYQSRVDADITILLDGLGARLEALSRLAHDDQAS
jgi:predicted DNA-binding protein